MPLEQFLSDSARPVGTKAFPVELSRALFTSMQRVGQAALDALSEPTPLIKVRRAEKQKSHLQ